MQWYHRPSDLLRLILIAKKQQHPSITHGNHDRQRKMTTVLCTHQLLATLADVPLRTLLMYCCVCSCIVLPLSRQHFCFSLLDIHKILTINKDIHNFNKKKSAQQIKSRLYNKEGFLPNHTVNHLGQQPTAAYHGWTVWATKQH